MACFCSSIPFSSTLNPLKAAILVTCTWSPVHDAFWLKCRLDALHSSMPLCVCVLIPDVSTLLEPTNADQMPLNSSKPRYVFVGHGERTASWSPEVLKC